MKKVFGIILALALVLSMAVMATPVGAAISNITVTQTNPIALGLSDYTIKFDMEQPLETVWMEHIDIGFPAGTDLTQVCVAAGKDITVAGTDSGGVAVTYSWLAAALMFNVIGDTLRIVLIAPAPGDLVAGTVTVVIEDVVNGAPCHQTLTVGTSHETAVESASYPIYLFEIFLNAGWNLISLPGIPEDAAIEVVLADLLPPTCAPGEHDFEVWYYDCGQWFVWCTDAPYETLTTMDECRAYWIKVPAAVSFKVKGIWQPPPPGPPLKKCYHECWNMVGFTSQVARDPFVWLLAAVGDDPYMATMAPAGSVFYILGWDSVNQVWQPIVQGTDLLMVGQGYWMAFVQDACFVPPVV